jgi:hypothetical protein
MSPAMKSRPLVADPRRHGGKYRPVPELCPFDSSTIAAQICRAHETGDTGRRNRLVAYAFARGATIRQLSDLTGLTSTSTVHAAIQRAQCDDPGVLLDTCPRGLR